MAIALEAALEARAVTKAFGGHHAVNRVDLTVSAGEIVALIGPNGAGKTSFLNLLAGQMALTSGSVHLAGNDVSTLPPGHEKRRSLLRSFQNGGVFGKLTATENVALAAIARGTHRRAAEKAARLALDEVGLKPVADWRADQLSGGQRKLIDFARMLIAKPAVALLDEPTAGVSPAITSVMSRILIEQRDNGLAAVIVSHDLPWVFGLSNRVLALAGGEILAEGAPDAVCANPAVQEAYLA